MHSDVCGSVCVYVHECIQIYVGLCVCARMHSVWDMAGSGSKSISKLLVSFFHFQLIGTVLFSQLVCVHLHVCVGVYVVHTCSHLPPEAAVGVFRCTVFARKYVCLVEVGLAIYP